MATTSFRSVLLTAALLVATLGVGFLLGRWSGGGEPAVEHPSTSSAPEPGPGVEPPRATRLTGRLPLPTPSAGGEERASSTAEEDAVLNEVSKRIWAEVPESNPGLRWAMLDLEHHVHPVLSRRTRRTTQILSRDRFVENVLRNRSMNPEGWKLSEERKAELQALLDESFEQERELLFTQSLLQAKADVEAFRNQTAIVTEDGGEKQMQEFARRYGELGKNWLLKFHGIPGPRKGTGYGVLYLRSTHPGIFEVADEMRRLREERKRTVRDFLRRYGYR